MCFALAAKTPYYPLFLRPSKLVGYIEPNCYSLLNDSLDIHIAQWLHFFIGNLQDIEPIMQSIQFARPPSRLYHRLWGAVGRRVLRNARLPPPTRPCERAVHRQISLCFKCLPLCLIGDWSSRWSRRQQAEMLADDD